MNILSVNNLNKEFRVETGFFLRKTDTVRALDDVSFELESGKVLGIIGESGSGKTTLARVLCKLVSPDSGNILINGRNLNDYTRQELSRRIQLIFQDPFASLNPKLSVGTILSEAIDQKTDNIAGLLRDILRTVGMPDDILHSYPHQFSGGQRQRIAIARALLKKPDIIIADEPLSSLDITLQSQILGLFKALKEKFGLTFIFISHDIVTTASFADYVIVMKNGKIMERGLTNRIIRFPENVYTRKLISAVPRFA